jgi:hypothetical protein
MEKKLLKYKGTNLQKVDKNHHVCVNVNPCFSKYNLLIHFSIKQRIFLSIIGGWLLYIDFFSLHFHSSQILHIFLLDVNQEVTAVCFITYHILRLSCKGNGVINRM